LKYSQISNDKYQKEAIELLNLLNKFKMNIRRFNFDNDRQMDLEYFKINTKKIIEILEFVTYTEKEVNEN